MRNNNILGLRLLQNRLTLLRTMIQRRVTFWPRDQYDIVFNSVEEKAIQVDEYRKDAEALKVLQDEVAHLRRELHDTLQRAMQNMLEVQKQVVEHGRKLCPDDVIYTEVIDLFMSAPGVTQGGGHDDCSSPKSRISIAAPEALLELKWASPGSTAYVLGLARSEEGCTNYT
ncbi:unnamed protein product [Vicia faba]|uniref:Uncharacterized protein n=1 Tax=Vicia faba TaxID=3906 RepID=A0AAV0ZGU8_VICFA|nr:unnamed protein product [Vicia faba]